MYFPFPGLFRNKLPSSRAFCSLHSPSQNRLFPLLLLLLLLLLVLPLLLPMLLLLLIVRLLLLLVWLVLLLLLLLLLLLVLLVLLLLVLLVLLLHTNPNHLSPLPLHLAHLFPMPEIPCSHRSACCLIVLKATWHIEDQIPPSPRRLLNTDAKLLRIAPVRYIVLRNP